MHFKFNLSYSGQDKNSENKSVTTLFLKNDNSVFLQYALWLRLQGHIYNRKTLLIIIQSSDDT